MKFIWDCTCGHAEECRYEDQCIGAVYQCSSCKQVWGSVVSRRGRKVWVKIAPGDVEFHDLLKEPECDEE